MIFKYADCLNRIKTARKNYYFLKLSCVLVILELTPLLLIANSQWRSGVIRIESDVSTGRNSFEEITQMAREKGLDFITFTDQFNVKVEYGLRPFPHVLKFNKTRKSINSYGIKKYIEEIHNLNEKYPDIVLIPGADLAPFYYWDGSFISGDLKCKRYSEQLTLIGSASSDFYKNLPVIHNDRFIFNKYILIKLLPILLAVLGIYMVLFRHLGIKPGEKTASPRITKQRLLVGIILIFTGILWTLNNRPFVHCYPYDQYKDYGILPFSYLANYINHSNEKEKVAIFWSAPGASMKHKIFGVELITQPYWRDVKDVDGFNGFAAIYGDALTAHLPGEEWDKMLLQHITGKRRSKPVTMGEIDYHGKKRRLDLIKTMVYTNDLTEKSIITALKRGNSYSYFHKGNFTITLNDIYMQGEENKEKCIPGETISDRTGKFHIKLSGKIEPDPYDAPVQAKRIPRIKPAVITVVVNGKATAFESLTAKDFNLDIPVTIPEKTSRGYVRIIINSPSTGLIVINPFFYKL